MGVDDTGSVDVESVIDDVAYLTRSEHRVPALVAMTERPRSRSELWEQIGVSSSTIRRTLREFEARNWIRRAGYRYEATELGAFIASEMEGLIERVQTERRLRDVWRWLPGEESGFTVEMCADATVTVADASDPYRPVNRLVTLARRTDRYRFVGCEVAVIEPTKHEFRRLVGGGMRTEVVDSPRVVEYVRSTDPALFAEVLDSGNLTVWVHDDLPPHGIGLFDDTVAITGYEPDSGTLRVLIDTDDPAAREWAESKFASYRDEARPLASEPIAE